MRVKEYTCLHPVAGPLTDLACQCKKCPHFLAKSTPLDDWPAGAEPSALSLALSVADLAPFSVTLPRLSHGSMQVWAAQGVAPVWGKAEPVTDVPGEWFSPVDWSASLYRFAHDGPNRRFVLALERYTPEYVIRLAATKLTLLSLTPFLAVGSGLLLGGESGPATTPCKALAMAPWSVTLTEAP